MKAYTLLILSLFSLKTYADTNLNRYRLIQDRLDTEDVLREPGHDFFLDLRATISRDIFDVIDDAEKASKTTGTDAEKLAAISAFLRKNDQKEQLGNVQVKLGAPLPSFTIFNTKIVPEVRVKGLVGALIRIKVRPLPAVLGPLINDLEAVPQSVKNEMSDLNIENIAAGTDLIQESVNQGLITQAEADLLVAQGLKIEMPDIAIPSIGMYAKNDITGGLDVRFIREDHFYGALNLYGLLRTDKSVQITEQYLRNQSKIADLKVKNTQTTIQTDLRLGYSDEEHDAYFMVKEIKLSRLSDKIATAGDVVDRYDPMFRVHGEKILRIGVFSVMPFLGAHKRTGYDLKDGWYGGARGAIGVWGDRLLLSLTGMFDDEFFTLSPRIRLWFLQADYSLRMPISSTTSDGLKTSALHSANLRIFF